MTRPLIIVDVDGPLNPWKAKRTRRPAGFETFRLHPRGWQGHKPLRVWLNPRHGDLLGAFADVTGGELVWCTSWQDQANELIAPLVGLPQLPVIYWDPHGTRWKYDAVLTYAGDRPLVWFDDDFDVYLTLLEWFYDQRAPRPTFLRHVDPAVGLTFGDVAVARQFLSTTDGGEDGTPGSE